MTDPQNGTEEVITSAVSKAFPVSDAALGGYTYILEILTGLVGARMRWRTMPWLVVLFGLMIAPLVVTSIFFIIIQPIVMGTWSIVALAGAAAVLIKISYSLDEMIATLQFLRRRSKAGPAVVKLVVAFVLIIQAAFCVRFDSLFGAVVGFRCTSTMGFQLRVGPDQRFGLA